MPAETNGTAEGVPSNWFVRIAFDRLLDPTIEDLVAEVDSDGNPTGTMRGTFEKTQPVTLKCGGTDIPYDGYYVPNGNSISWPIGPALFISPIDPTAAETGASCEVTILDKVHSKSGEPVPTGERTFKFLIKGMEVLHMDPDPADADAQGSFEMDPADPLTYTWTASIGTAPAAAEITIIEGANGAGSTPNAAVCSGTGTAATAVAEPDGKDDTVLNLGVSNAAMGDHWKADTTYRVKFTPNAKVAPAQGGTPGGFPADYSFCFHTPAA